MDWARRNKQLLLMLKIDTHQHFWKYNPTKQAWINEEMSAIRKDFMPTDLQPILNKAGVSGCIAIQADESEAETDFLVALANDNPFIKGVIGWVDFLAEDIYDRLAYYAKFEAIKGFRYNLQDKKQRDLMLNEEFIRGIFSMNDYDLVYELLIHSDQITYADQLVKHFPEQVFVLDHIAKPLIKKGEIAKWKKAIIALSKNENVYCKISGMATEADWKNWKYQDLEPYMDVVFSSFGADRVMFGSDWPVCNLAGDYQRVMEIVDRKISDFSVNDQQKFWSANAIKCYQL